MHDKINQFISHFNEEIHKVKELNNKLYQKIIYVTILDALGRARYPKKSPSDRMKTFVRNYGNWADKDKISLVQLELNLDFMLTDEEKESSRLLLTTREKIATWESGHVYDSSADPVFDEGSKMLTFPDKRVDIENAEESAVTKARYSELFYAYRNRLIHEYRKPGYAIEDNEDTSAFYHSYINGPWELGFPVGLFEKLCCSCLENLKQYLYHENINPYSRYEFGSMWSERKHFAKP
ncbi:hypothetical protein AXX12_03360 [Anaerosporomusa subterranea]|uniref:Uncharacterized protein n=1 Tax=Anaerosporomusa subterranea TaxID=1794912 RepID=A0A154BT39_ANASB|nr:hypothetical protein [Anaerosporomusa subterranea]KYZ77184.1 hypothetical protein AXX12_03360 [Anaerosporomusa subterranea]